jgi:MYXO-CTERM domain-containing protein
MKKVTKFLTVLTLTAFLGFSSPVVMAQTSENTTTTTTTADDDDMDDDDGDGGRWGLAGLLGLLGLLGLKRRDDDATRTTTTRVDRP